MLAPAPDPRHDGAARGPTWVLWALATTVVVYVATMLVPWAVNGLVPVPLAELASGLHDPRYLWPTGRLNGPVSGLALLSAQLLLLLPLVGAALWGVRAVRARRDGDRAGAVRAAVVVLVCAGVLAWVASPLGTALLAWRMD